MRVPPVAPGRMGVHELQIPFIDSVERAIVLSKLTREGRCKPQAEGDGYALRVCVEGKAPGDPIFTQPVSLLKIVSTTNRSGHLHERHEAPPHP